MKIVSGNVCILSQDLESFIRLKITPRKFIKAIVTVLLVWMFIHVNILSVLVSPHQIHHYMSGASKRLSP